MINFTVLLIERMPTCTVRCYVVGITVCTVLVVVFCGKWFNAEVLYMIISYMSGASILSLFYMNIRKV
jgi:hypothetical protein